MRGGAIVWCGCSGHSTLEMRKLQSEISILSRIKKQTSQLLTAGDIANRSSNSYKFMKNIRGTASYWKDQLLDLLAKINTLGPPTFFVTRSQCPALA